MNLDYEHIGPSSWIHQIKKEKQYSKIDVFQWSKRSKYAVLGEIVKKIYVVGLPIKIILFIIIIIYIIIIS